MGSPCPVVGRSNEGLCSRKAWAPQCAVTWLRCTASAGSVTSEFNSQQVPLPRVEAIGRGAENAALAKKLGYNLCVMPKATQVTVTLNL